ncbi:MAG TPA: hypothetical protein VL977_01750 [Solirubrobacteraceae bacterium]|nr:hypothetical protein [Solirubrobacteraceae bacterium]
MTARRATVLALLSLLALPAAAGATGVSQTVTGAIDATNVHYRSTLTRVSPLAHGVSWTVIDLSDEIQLTNRSSEPVTVFGYDDEPYLRILPDRAVELNENSPAYYLNQSFFASGIKPPPYATATAAPHWVTVARTGSFTWHDHRIHFYSPATPPEVKNVDRTTLVFDWKVPIEVGSTRGALHGKLVWIGEKPFSFPLAAIVALALIVIASAAFVVLVRRRRRRAARGPDAPSSW